MKKDLVYSVLFHLMLFLLAFIIIRHTKAVKAPAPFVATIITPEELRGREAPKMPRGRQEKNLPRMPRIPKDMPAPQEFSAIPSSPAPAKKSSSAAPAEKAAAANASRDQSRGGPEPALRQDAEGMAQPLTKGGAVRGPSQAGGQFPSARTTRDRLFDKDVIAKSSPRETGNSKNDNAVSFDTKEYKYYGYMQRLREKIEGAWKYPYEAEQKKINGELYIKFTIRKDGKLAAVELVHTSGYKFLDDAAIRALRDADPYWPLPDSWKEDSLTITGRFIYYFSNTYIR
ncbi:MAG: TonB C-terminal domain-containing protein [Nitrospirae bacterium]|nr:TonB C-terminal domain-containing protein [Nitrospirota bacterium]